MEFFNIEIQSELLAKRTSDELLEAAWQAEKAGKYKKAFRLYGRSEKRRIIETYGK